MILVGEWICFIGVALGVLFFSRGKQKDLTEYDELVVELPGSLVKLSIAGWVFQS